MDTNLDVANDQPLHQAATELLSAAMHYWKEYRRVTGGAAVVWLSDTDGRLVILTRGEYRDTLLHNIEILRDEAKFNAAIRPFDSKEIP